MLLSQKSARTALKNALTLCALIPVLHGCAGSAALTCYLLSYAWHPLKNLVFSDPLLRPEFSVGLAGLVNSLVYALVLIWTVWLLGRVGVKLKV